MQRLFFTLTGALFGIILYKSEVISWYRIQEMFRFQSFHMYGVLGCAVLVSMVSLQVMKRLGVRTVSGQAIVIPLKQRHHGNWIGGTLFGMGWALTGACPGPLFAHIGAGNSVMIVTILCAIIGTWIYSALRPRLPH